MSAYLTATELADMIGCERNSFACMRRWLKRNDWPFEANLRGFPKVSRAYHDARMAGHAFPNEKNADLIEPDFSMFKKV